jgi:hypothetical protein
VSELLYTEGDEVVAVFSRLEHHAWLRELGASDVLRRDELALGERPLGIELPRVPPTGFVRPSVWSRLARLQPRRGREEVVSETADLARLPEVFDRSLNRGIRGRGLVQLPP